MPTLELRPLSLGELLDRTFFLYRANFWVFVGIMAIPAAFSIPFSVLYFSLQGASIFRPTGMAMAGGIFAGLFVFIILLNLVYAVAVGAATYAVSEVYLGQPASIRGSYKKVRHKLGKIVGVTLNIFLRILGVAIVGAIVFALVVALLGLAIRGIGSTAAPVVVGVVAGLSYLALLVLFMVWVLRYALSIQALLLEDMGISASIRRSVQLTAGRKWQILVAIVVMVMMTYVGVIIFQVPFFVLIGIAGTAGPVPAWLAFTSAISGAIGGALTGPLLMITLVLLYYDARIRKEGFDLQFMMSSLDAVPAPGAALPG